MGDRDHLPGPLVSAGWLRANLASSRLRVLDMRWSLTGPPGRDSYLSGHIPGAVFVDLDDITAEEGVGRHPMPSGDRFTLAMRAAGVNADSDVVVYDHVGASVAARLWWLLHHFGHRRAAVLDGGLQAWAAPLEYEPVEPEVGNFQAGSGEPEAILTYHQVGALGSDIILLDARAPQRFRGELEPVDPQAGHIPGALNAPWEGNLDGEGRMLPPGQLRGRYAALGVTSAERAVVYCGSGVTACQLLLAMESAGLGRARLYAGSWSDWSSRSEVPIAVGP